MESVSERLNKLYKSGYICNFTIKNGHLFYEDKKMIDNKDIHLDDTFRIEDDSDPDSQTVIYALSTKVHKLKGLIIDSFGLYADPEKIKFVQSLEKAARFA